MKRIISFIFMVLFSLVLISCIETDDEQPLEQYIVIFVDYDDTVLKQETVEEGDSATAPQSPIRAGYTFDMWDKSFTNVTSNLTVKALYTKDDDPIVSYKVRFVDYDDTLIKEETVESGKSATAPSNPTRVGYKFDKWDTSFTNITKDLTVKALYTIDENPTKTTYTVVFLDFKGEILKEEEVLPGSNATPPETPSVVGYTFNKWETDFNNVTSDLSIKPVYDLITYSITYVLEEEQINLNTVTSYNIETETFTLIDAIDGSYVFLGWFDEEGNIITEIKQGSTSNLTLTAKFSEEEYRIIFKQYAKELKSIDQVYFPFFITGDKVLMLTEDMLFDITSSLEMIDVSINEISFVQINYGLQTDMYGIYIKNELLNQLLIISDDIYGTVTFEEEVVIDYVNIFDEYTYHIYANGYKDLYTIVESDEIDFNFFGSENAFNAVKETNKFNLATNELFDASLIKGSKIIITTDNNRYYDSDLFVLDNKELDFSKNISETNNIQLLGTNTSIHIGESLTYIFNNNVVKSEEFRLTLEIDSDDRIIKVSEMSGASFIITLKNRHFFYYDEVLIEMVLPEGEVTNKLGYYYNYYTDDNYIFAITNNKKTFVLSELDYNYGVHELVEQDIKLGNAKLIDYFYYYSEDMYFLFDDGSIMNEDNDIFNAYLAAEQVKHAPGETIELTSPGDVYIYKFLYWTYYNEGEYIKVEDINSIKNTYIELAPYYEAKLNFVYNNETFELTLDELTTYTGAIRDLVYDGITNHSFNFEIYLDSEYKELLIDIKYIKNNTLYVKDLEDEDSYYVHIDGIVEGKELREDQLTKDGIYEAFNIELLDDVVWYYRSHSTHYETRELDFDNFPLGDDYYELNFKIIKKIKVFAEEKEYEYIYLSTPNQSYYNEIESHYEFMYFVNQNIGYSEDYILFDENDNLIIYIFELEGNEAYLYNKSELSKIYLNEEEFYLLPDDEGKIYLPDFSLIDERFYNFKDDEGIEYNVGDEISSELELVLNYSITYELIIEERSIPVLLVYKHNMHSSDLFELFLQQISDYHIVKLQGNELYDEDYLYYEFNYLYNRIIDTLELEVYKKDDYNKVIIHTMNRYQDYVVYIKKDEPLINALGALVDFSIIGLIDEDGEIVDVDKVLTENTVKLYALHLTKVIIESRSTWESYDLGELEISILTYEEVIKEALEEMGLIVYGEISTNYYNGRFQGEFYNEETEFLIEIVNLEYGNSDYRIFRKDDNDFGYYLHNGFHVKDEQGNFIRLTSDNYQEENMILYDIRWSYIDVVINIGDDSYDWKVYYNEFEYNINDFVERNFYNKFIIEYKDVNGNVLTKQMLENNIYIELNLTLGSIDDYIVVWFESSVGIYKEMYLEKDEDGFATLPEYNYEGEFSEYFYGWFDFDNNLYVPGEKIDENKVFSGIFKTSVTLYYDNKTLELPETAFYDTYDLDRYVIDYIENFDNDYYFVGAYLDKDFKQEALYNNNIYDVIYLDVRLVSEYVKIEIIDHYNNTNNMYVKKGENFKIEDEFILDYLKGYNVIGFVDSNNNLIDENQAINEPIKLYPIYFIEYLEYYDIEKDEYSNIQNLEISIFDHYDKIIEKIGVEDKVYMISPFYMIIDNHDFSVEYENEKDYVVLTTIDGYGYSYQRFISKNELLKDEYGYYLFEKDENNEYILFDSYQKITENITLYESAIKIDIMFAGNTITHYFTDILNEPIEMFLQNELEWQGYFATSFTIENGGSIENGRLVGTTNHVIISANGFTNDEGFKIVFQDHKNIYVLKDNDGKAYLPQPIAYEGEHQEYFIGWKNYNVGDEIYYDHYYYPEFEITYQVLYDGNLVEYEVIFGYNESWNLYNELFWELDELGYYVIGIYSDSEFEFEFDPFIETVYVDVRDKELFNVVWLEMVNRDIEIYLQKEEPISSLLDYDLYYNVVGFVDEYGTEVSLDTTLDESVWLYPIYYVETLYVRSGWEYEIINGLYVSEINFKEVLVSRLNDNYYYEISNGLWSVVVENEIFVSLYSKEEYKMLTIIYEWGPSYHIIQEGENVIYYIGNRIMFELIDDKYVFFDSRQPLTSEKTIYALDVEFLIYHDNELINNYKESYYYALEIQYIKDYIWQEINEINIISGGTIIDGYIVPSDIIIEIEVN